MGAALIMSAGMAGAATLVVRSSGPSAGAYPAGKPIADTARIVLKANDQLTILDGRGTRTLKGPGTFSPTASAAPAAAGGSSIASLVTQRSDRRARIGAVRSVGGVSGPARNPNIWFVDVAKSANVCVADPAAVTLWRASADDAATMTVSGGGKSETIQWAKGQSARAWPAALAVTNGAQFQLAGGSMAPTALKFTVLGANPEGLESTAAALIKNDCKPQLDLLIETVALPDTAQPAG